MNNNIINKPTLVLVDGSSYLFRAYYALPPLTTSKGQATGAILGVINMLKKLVNTYAPNLMVVVFDSPEETNRHKLFPEYKATRIKMPEDLATQIHFLLEIIAALGFKILKVPGIEADDLIGSLVVQARLEGISSIVSTGDKDLAQLVNEDVILINTMTDQVLDLAGVLEKFKVPADLIVDYLTLIGDSVDNIPGIPNVGPKTAVKWLQQYNNLDGIIKHSNEIGGKVGENLRASINKLPLYKELITIDPNLDLNIKIKDLVINPKDFLKLKELFTELEFNNWLKECNNELSATKSNNASNNSKELSLVTSVSLPSGEARDAIHEASSCKQDNSSFDLWVPKLAKAQEFSIHLKTTSADPMLAEIKGIYLAVNQEHCYIELDDPLELNKLKIFFIDPNKTKIAYNFKYVAQVLENYSIKIVPPYFDVTLESYVINSLIKLDIQSELITAEKILALHYDLWPKICEFPKLKEVLVNIELPLLMVLKKMERIGVLIDVKKLAKQGAVIKEKLISLERDAYLLAGEEFNLNSPKQLQEILFVKLGLPILQKTPKGQPSTSEQVLQELALEFELPTIILQYRTLSKLQSTYIEKLPKTINPKTGRIHTSYNQTITATGRLSSSDPNLQNIPIRSKEGRAIREAFIARPGYKILSADYSQIELRILAHLSQDPGLLKAFTAGLDIHLMTASEVFKVAIPDVTADLRRKAKAINFGLMYGMSDFGLAKQLKISRQEAELYIKIYFAKFPKVLEFIEHIRHTAIANGFVETMFGRRLYLPDINSKNAMLRKAAERAAINAPMQGAQADLIKIAMINVDKWLQLQAPDLFMLMQVHDELVFEVPKEKVDFATNNIVKIMQLESEIKLLLTLQVDVGVGDNWAQAHS